LEVYLDDELDVAFNNALDRIKAEGLLEHSARGEQPVLAIEFDAGKVEVEKLKSEGGAHVKNGDFQEATASYKASLAMSMRVVSGLKQVIGSGTADEEAQVVAWSLALHLNLSLCAVKEERWQEGVDEAT